MRKAPRKYSVREGSGVARSPKWNFLGHWRMWSTSLILLHSFKTRTDPRWRSGSSRCCRTSKSRCSSFSLWEMKERNGKKKRIEKSVMRRTEERRSDTRGENQGGWVCGYRYPKRRRIWGWWCHSPIWMQYQIGLGFEWFLTASASGTRSSTAPPPYQIKNGEEACEQWRQLNTKKRKTQQWFVKRHCNWELSSNKFELRDCEGYSLGIVFLIFVFETFFCFNEIVS